MRIRPAKRLLVASLLALALVGVPSASVLADDTECVGAVAPPGGPPGFAPGTVHHGDVVVRTYCRLIDVVVLGSVKVLPGANGFHSHNSFIRGDVLAPGPFTAVPGLADIRILDSTVGGSVYVAGTLPGSAGATCRSTIGGDLVYKNNRGSNTIGVGFPSDVCTGGNTIQGSIIFQDNQPTPIGVFNTINNNRVHEDLVVVNNTSATPISIFTNTVSKTLKCQDNTPPPTGSLNRAEKKEGQCASL